MVHEISKVHMFTLLTINRAWCPAILGVRKVYSFVRVAKKFNSGYDVWIIALYYNLNLSKDSYDNNLKKQ